jgi:hypothetical protein
LNTVSAIDAKRCRGLFHRGACVVTDRLLLGEQLGQVVLRERIGQRTARDQREPVRQALHVALRFGDQLHRVCYAVLDDRVDQQIGLVGGGVVIFVRCVKGLDTRVDQRHGLQRRG